MPLILPNLDDVTWDQLNEEARAQIPAYAPGWTNHNPSDPGITLLEVLAYFSEMMLYRVNRISDAQTIKFLQLLNGPEWKPKSPLDQEKIAAIANLRRTMRVVTAADYEALTLSVSDSQTPESVKADRVARAKCVPERNLEGENTESYEADAPGHISVVVVSGRRRPPTQALLRRVKHALQTAKLLTTQVHVTAARFFTFSLQVTLVLQPEASADWVQSAALHRLEDFFDPLEGGFDGKGWSFGRNIYVSEVYRVLDTIPGVDYVIRSKDAKTSKDCDELVVGPSEEHRLRFNSLGELEAIELHVEELPALWISPDDIVIQKAGRR